MRNAEVASVLDELADVMEFLGEDRYRVASYRDAATRIEHLSEPVEDLYAAGRLQEVHGIGRSIAAKIGEYLETGTIAALEERRRRVPPAAVTLMNVPGIGPRRAMALARELHIESVADLERAIESGAVAALPRVGEKVAQHILRELRARKAAPQRLPLGVALAAAEEVTRQLRACPAAGEMAAAGSIRRMKETIGDIDVLVASEAPAEVIGAFTRLPLTKEVLAAGEKRASVLTHSGQQVDLRVIAPESWGAALQYFTGSKEHNVKLRNLAVKKGLKLNEYGVFRGERQIAGRTEEEVYQALSLPWLPPEIREDRGEVEAALAGQAPQLLSQDDIRGDLHCHSRYSDGASTLEQMAAAAAARGYEYIAFTDHSQALGVTGGLSEDEFREQHARIRALQSSFPGTRLLCGVEVDIRVDCTLDCSDEFLDECDVVVASVHSALQRSREEQTARLIAAMENPRVDIIAHPTGRLLGRRPGYEIDLGAVLEAAARTKTAVEVNGQPERLDLNGDAVRAAVERGVTIVVNTDAHHADQLAHMRFGVATARRGWATPASVLNTLPAADLLRWLRDRRPGGS
jgi:DNA polymerase (family 10)